MTRLAGVLALVMGILAAPVTAQPRTTGPQQCPALGTLELPGVALTEMTADWMPAGPAPDSSQLPAYCRLRGTLNASLVLRLPLSQWGTTHRS